MTPSLAAGVHDIPASVYHADPCIAPSLSASIAKLLLDCPRKAWHAHPKLGAGERDEPTNEQDIGTAVHSTVLGKGADVVYVSAKDWRTAEAREKRDAARKAGKVAILDKGREWVGEMVDALRGQLATHEIGWPFRDGWPERTLIWQDDGGIWCRSMLDYWRPQDALVVDYKTTAGSADPEIWSRRLFELGMDIQCAFYLRGLRAAGLAHSPRFLFVVQETSAPYAACVVGLTPAALDMANRKVDQAVRLWGECLGADRWPGYPAMTCWVDLPPWEEKRLIERENRDEIAKSAGKSRIELAMDFYKP